MLLGLILIVIGAALAGFGAFMAVGWVGGRSTWFDAGVFDRQGSSKNDRQFLDLYFIALVIGPLLGGGILIVMGLMQWQ
jgi:hypothetical protein